MFFYQKPEGHSDGTIAEVLDVLQLAEELVEDPPLRPVGEGQFAVVEHGFKLGRALGWESCDHGASPRRSASRGQRTSAKVFPAAPSQRVRGFG